jgi:hypothetical protein
MEKTQYKSLLSPCGAVRTVREQWSAMDMMWNECAVNKNKCTNKNQMCPNRGNISSPFHQVYQAIYTLLLMVAVRSLCIIIVITLVGIALSG